MRACWTGEWRPAGRQGRGGGACLAGAANGAPKASPRSVVVGNMLRRERASRARREAPRAARWSYNPSPQERRAQPGTAGRRERVRHNDSGVRAVHGHGGKRQRRPAWSCSLGTTVARNECRVCVHRQPTACPVASHETAQEACSVLLACCIVMWIADGRRVFRN